MPRCARVRNQLRTAKPMPGRVGGSYGAETATDPLDPRDRQREAAMTEHPNVGLTRRGYVHDVLAND
jgi:hypothetical protein